VKPFEGRPVIRWRKRIGWRVRSWLDRGSKARIIASLPRGASVLDVGCGNESASEIMNHGGDLRLSGIDVGDYCITPADKALMDYRLCPPAAFAEGILAFGTAFDLVLSAHNLEHCDDPDKVLGAMCTVVRPGGRLFLSFPSEASVDLPSRGGCLNFHDDPTHQTLPGFDRIVAELRARGFTVDLAVRRNRGNFRIGWCIGAVQEPWSRLSGRVQTYTWQFWGFESVIIARRAARDEARPPLD
jgi:SAM-dependent methyltransferase